MLTRGRGGVVGEDEEKEEKEAGADVEHVFS